MPNLEVLLPNGEVLAVLTYIDKGLGSGPEKWDGAVSISGPVTAAVTNDGTFATPARQDTGNTSLASIKTNTDKIPSLGQALAASSVPIVLTAIQQAALTPPAAITNYANETGGNLASIKAKTDNIPALGQALAASSVPIVLTAIQVAALTPLSTVVANPTDNTWAVHHIPAANTQATITQASGGGGIKNVCTGFTVTICAGATAPAAIQLSVALIDGASGGTTYLWRSNISLPAVAGAITAFVNTNEFVGSAATAMTLEFSVIGGANTFESVSMKGYTK